MNPYSEMTRQTALFDRPEAIAADDASLIYLQVEGQPKEEACEKRQLLEEMSRLDRLNLVGEMAASVGHEVRNPMTTVRGFLQMLRSKPELTGFTSYFDLMVDELDRANSIITEFLSIAKNHLSQQQPGKLEQVIAVLMPMLDAGALMTGTTVLFMGGPVPPVVMAERDIRQLVLNLVRNASEVTPSGGQIIIRTYVENDKVVLAISDQGPGIPADVQQKLGTAFFTTKEKGTGIGLTVCRHIAERHHADLAFRTGPQGTTFYVFFPMAKADEARPAAATAETADS
ncbi:MAG: ATP-binding protein [Sporomusaceae bacterium]|nr:ATP-binding protein [Sporomusaceae bacterium]